MISGNLDVVEISQKILMQMPMEKHLIMRALGRQPGKKSIFISDWNGFRVAYSVGLQEALCTETARRGRVPAQDWVSTGSDSREGSSTLATTRATITSPTTMTQSVSTSTPMPTAAAGSVSPSSWRRRPSPPPPLSFRFRSRRLRPKFRPFRSEGRTRQPVRFGLLHQLCQCW